MPAEALAAQNLANFPDFNKPFACGEIASPFLPLICARRPPS
jgi:hypothetical protein